MRSLIRLCILIFLVNFEITAQKGVELGAWMGISHYFGDLNNLYRLNEPGLAGGFIGRYNIDSRLSTQLLMNYTRIRGNDSKSSNLFDQRRNLSFYSDIVEICPSLVLNFFPVIHGRSDYGFSPHLTAGFSIFYHDPKIKYNGEPYHLRELGTEGQPSNQEYSLISGGWLLGAGMKLDLNYRWSINVDLNARFAFTDYLDDVSKTYPNFGTLLTERGPVSVALSDPSIPSANGEKIGKTGFQRGDSKERDMFVTLGIGMLYYFGRLDCPTISHPE
ncbi:MAG: outer membrane beta-barrel protein [Saprospiraceae bacterium]|nr:outer membrane beta-barrel protein [Saprospiraceae bacterium]